jgi:hypothetical protein
MKLLHCAVCFSVHQTPFPFSVFYTVHSTVCHSEVQAKRFIAQWHFYKHV